MEITDVKIMQVNIEKIKAFAHITFDACFVVTGIKVICGVSEKYFVAMPHKRLADGKHFDICYPITKEMKKMIEDKVLGAFESELSKVNISQ